MTDEILARMPGVSIDECEQVNHDLTVPSAAPAMSVVVPGELRVRVLLLINAMELAPLISDAHTFDIIRGIVKRASDLRADIEACRSTAKQPFAAIAASIDAAAREVRAPLEMIIEEGKRQETAYIVERNRLLAEEAERIRLAELAAKASQDRPTPSLLPAVAAVEATPIAAEPVKAPLTTRWEVKVVMEAQIPRQFWTLDVAKIEAEWRAGRPVPGTTYEAVQYVVAR